MILQVFNHFKDLDYEQKKEIKNVTYNDVVLTMLNEIVTIDDFEEKTGIVLDSAKSVVLTEGLCGIARKGEKYFLVFHIRPVGDSKGMFNTSFREMKVTGTYLNDGELNTEEFVVNKDIVLWYNNPWGLPEFNIDQLSEFFTEIDTSLNCGIIFSRNNPFLEVENETEKMQYEKALKESESGKMGILINKQKNNPYTKVKENNIVNVTDVNTSDKLQYLSHLYDDMFKRIGNMYGCCFNASSKQAQMTEKEVSGMESVSWLLPISMLRQAQEFCDRFRKVYGVDLIAHFGIVHELNYHKFMNECTKEDSDGNVETEQEHNESEGEEDGDN